MGYQKKDATLTVFGLFMLFALAVGASMLPELWRYLKIRSM